MQIDYCLILSAGFGTRMGEIGKKLPKVLWPVFEKSILELQVAFARSLGAKKIYINLHHMGEQIEAFCKDRSAFDDVEFLWEKPEILNIGGGIHNLASRPEVAYRGRLLVLNADQFFYLQKEQLFKYLEQFKDSPAVLFSYWVDPSLGYTALEYDENRNIKNIVMNKDLPAGKQVETYTGISLIDLSKLEPVKGPSTFFESVCPYKKKKIPSILLEGVDYWDFGTVKRYWQTCFNILSTYRVNSNHPFLRFLVQEKALKTWKIDLQKISYNAKSPNVINLCPEAETKELDSSIILGPSNLPRKSKSPTIYWGELMDEIK